MASQKGLLVGAIIAIIIVGIAGFFAGQQFGGKVTTTTYTETVGEGGVVTTTVTTTVTTGGGGFTYTPPEQIKAAFIYVGPVGDFGWTYMHDLGRRVIDTLFGDKVITAYSESVAEGQEKDEIENYISQGYNVIFTTSFGFMEGTLDAAKNNPDVMFFHCSGYLRYTNMGTYFADLYQVYYLNGLIAGALTKTGHLGYVAAFTIPEVVRHINAFAIGAKEIGEQLGKDIKVYVIEIGAWFNPEAARAAAETLVNQYNVDAIAYTEDSTAIIEYAQQLYEQTGKQIYVFSHYSPGYAYGPDVVVSGQIVRWEVIYTDIAAKILAGIYTPYNLQNVDYWYLLNTGAVEFGADINYTTNEIMHINPKFIDELKSITVTDKLTGQQMSAYDLIMKRYEEMKFAPLEQPLQGQANTHIYENLTTIDIGGKEKKYWVGPVFDPFTGPLDGYKKDNPSEKVHIRDGVRLSHDDLWNMDWFVDWVEYLGGGT